MAEVLISVPVTVKCHGFARLKGIYCHGNCFCRVYGSNAVKINRDHEELCELNVVSMQMNGLRLFGGMTRMMSQMRLMVRFGKVENFVDVSDLIASKGSPLVCEENEEKKMEQSRNDEVDSYSSGKNLPPWGNLIVPQGSMDMNCSESVVVPSIVSKDEIIVDKSRVHFLEETDEEELSRRILMLSRSNKVRSALELFWSLEFSGLRATEHACNSLLSCLIRNEHLGNALRVFEFMKTNEIAKGHAYSLILKAVAGTEGCDSALNMFKELKEKDDIDVVVYNTMVSLSGRVNNWVETERIWKRMKEKGHIGTQITYLMLVRIFVRCGKNDLALDAYTEMVQQGLSPRDETMQAVIGASAKEGKWDLALCLFQKMLSCQLKPNLKECNALINSLGKAGQVKLAFETFETVKRLGHTPDSYTWNALLSGLYRANQHANVLQLFGSIKTEQRYQLNEHLYNTALMSCQKLGLWDKAVQLLWQAETSGLSISAASYNLVIGACEVARKPKVALEVYEHMIHQKCTPDTFTYLSLVRGCIWASLWTEVEEILDQVGPDVSLYNAVIHGMCLTGKVESARKLYMKMRDSGLKPDGKTRALMLQNLRRASTKRIRSSTHPRKP